MWTYFGIFILVTLIAVTISYRYALRKYGRPTITFPDQFLRIYNSPLDSELDIGFMGRPVDMDGDYKLYESAQMAERGYYKLQVELKGSSVCAIDLTYIDNHSDFFGLHKVRFIKPGRFLNS